MDRVESQIVSNTANPAVDAKFAEIDAAIAALKATQAEIGSTAERLASLRTHEGMLEVKITQLTSEHRSMITADTTATANLIKGSVQTDEEKMRELQTQLQHLEESRSTKLRELKSVETYGHSADASVAAGAPQRTNVDVARYDLSVPDMQTGSSHDPLAQTPVRLAPGVLGHHFDHRKHEGLAPSIDQIGMHATASPYVRPEDYKINGARPAAPTSAKFSDWKSPVRNSTRVAQPPGGYSHMESIFG